MSLLFAGCAARVNAPAATKVPQRIELPRMLVTPDEKGGVETLYTQALALEAAGQFKQAAPKFRRVFELEPESGVAAQALFRAASSADEAGNFDVSLADYEEFYRAFPRDRLARIALVRSARLLLFRERWERAGEVSDILLAQLEGLADLARVTVYSAKALSLLAREDDERAAYFVEKGRETLDALNLDAAGKLPRDAAALYFALGEVRRLRADRIHFNPVPKDFAQVLEQRCQLLLDAQSAYSNSMRAYDAHWSAIAGYRVGALYHSLHADLMQVPPPAAAKDLRKQQLFEGAMRLRYSVLLQKAQTMMQHTVSMADRTGEVSEWVDRARAARQQLTKDVQQEQASMDRLGYTRAELQAALDALATRASARKSP